MTWRALLPLAIAALAVAAEGNQAPSFSVPALVTGSENQGDPVLITVSEAVPGPEADYGQGLDLLVTVATAGTQPVTLGAITRLTPAGVYPATFTITLPVVSNRWGDVDLLVTANDGTGSASALTTRRVTVRIAQVNVVPVFVSSEPVRVVPGGSAVLSYRNLSVWDADTALDQVVFTLTAVPAAGDLRLDGIPLGVGDVFTQRALQSGRLAYRSRGADGVDGFAATCTDGIIPAPIGPFAVAVLVESGAHRPALVLNDGGPWVEGSGPVPVLAGANLIDDDSPTLGGGSVTVAVTGGGRVGDRLMVADQGSGAGQIGVAGRTVSYGGLPIGTWSGGEDGPLAVALAGGDASRTAVIALLRALRFDHAGQDPGPDPRRIALVVEDGVAAPSLPAEVALAVVPVDDPPAVITTRLATVAGLERSVSLAVRDPDSAALTWAVAGQPDNAVVTMLDAAAGLLRIVPTASGRSPFTVTVADATSTVSASIVLVVTGADDARPHAAGTLPHDGYAGEAVSVDLPWDLRDLPADARLAFSATGAPPGDLVLTPLAADRVRVAFAIPAAAGPQPVFGLLAEDAASGAAAHLPVHLLVRPRPEARR